MFCPGCGTELHDGIVFCHWCGKQVPEAMKPAEAIRPAVQGTVILTCPECGKENLVPDPPKARKAYRCGKCNARLSEPSDARKRSRSIAPFASARTLAILVTVAFAVLVVLDVVAIVSNYAQVSLLSRESYTLAEAMANDDRQAIIGYQQSGIYAVTAIAFLLWIHRSHKNLPALGARRLKYTPGWAVGWFFVPIFSLFRPVQVVTEIWRASDPAVGHEEDWQKAPTSPLIGLWWALFLISNWVGLVAVRILLTTPESVTDFMGTMIYMTWVLVAIDAVEIPGAIVAIFLVRALGARQEKKHSQLRGF